MEIIKYISDHLKDFFTKNKESLPSFLVYILHIIIIIVIVKDKQSEIKETYDNQLKSIQQNFDFKILEIRNQQTESTSANFKEKANYILETAKSYMQLPDSITSYFNTLPQDRPLLQISNYTQFPNSSLNYSYEATSNRNDTLALYFWIHNTSYNDAINPKITVTPKKTSANLVCFSTKIDASNMNDCEYGSAYLLYKTTEESTINLKNLFCFKVLDIKIYGSKLNILNNNPVYIYSYPESFCFNEKYNIYTSTIPALLREENLNDWYYNQFCILMRIIPVYSD